MSARSARRVLMLAYFFPPLGGIASLRALRFARGLPEFGWEALVVAPQSGDYHRDPALRFPESAVVRTPSLELSRVGRRAVRKVTGKEDRARASAVSRVRRFARRWLYLPDPQVGWYPFALSAARAAVRERRVDAIISSSYPITAHFVARRLHRETGLPWLADFRDLWSDWAWQGERRRRIEERMERALLREATAVVTVSPTYAGVLRSRGAAEVEILTNGYDPEDFAAERGAPDIYASYLGTYYPGAQDLSAALQAIADLARDGTVPDARVRFIGELDPQLKTWLETRALLDRVETTGWLPHAEALRQLCRARVLLLAGPLSSDTLGLQGNIAAKAFEYLGSGRPILMIGDPASDLAKILGPFRRVRIVPPQDVGAARAALIELDRWEPDGLEPGLEAYTARALTRRLATLLDRVSG